MILFDVACNSALIDVLGVVVCSPWPERQREKGLVVVVVVACFSCLMPESEAVVLACFLSKSSNPAYAVHATQASASCSAVLPLTTQATP